MKHNGLVYGKLRVCARGFSAGKSDVVKAQQPLAETNVSN